MAWICLRPGLSEGTFFFSNKAIHVLTLAQGPFVKQRGRMQESGCTCLSPCILFFPEEDLQCCFIIRKGKSGNNRTFCWFTAPQDWRSICCDRRWAWSDLRQMTSRHIWALCKNEDKFPLWMFIFLFVNKDHLKAGKSLPQISVVACDLSCLHLSKQSRNRNIFAPKSQDKITN